MLGMTGLYQTGAGALMTILVVVDLEDVVIVLWLVTGRDIAAAGTPRRGECGTDIEDLAVQLGSVVDIAVVALVLVVVGEHTSPVRRGVGLHLRADIDTVAVAVAVAGIITVAVVVLDGGGRTHAP